jgi:hypothetical protein
VDLKIDSVTQDVISKIGKVVSTFHEGIEPDPQIKAEFRSISSRRGINDEPRGKLL